MTNKKSWKGKGVFFASLAAVLWGFLSIMIKVALNYVEHFTIIWFRFTLAAFVLLIYYLIKSPSLLSIFRKPPFVLLLAAVFLGINYWGFTHGVGYTSPNNAQILIQLGPVLLALAGILIYKERISFIQGFGFLIAGFGLFLFYNEQIQLFLGQKEVYNKGMLLVGLAAVSWTVFAILQKKLVGSYKPQQLNLFIYAFCSILFLPISQPISLLQISWVSWLLLVFLGINTLVAYGSIAIALKHLEANKISIILTLNPIITFTTMAILGALQVDWINPEGINLKSVLGAVLVVSGAVVAVGYKKE